ncbi:MAG: rod shape-determining protein MreC [Betaproteobacteria bacterium]|nr:MAG: rod shape-determining protein MreC [Betaproteobacteria bacterium]
MRHISVEPPPFFHRGPSPLARLAFFGLLSLALLFADTRYRYLESVRHAVAVVLYPLQRAVQLPAEVLAQVTSYFSSQAALAEDNAALRQQLLSEAPVVQGYQLLLQENARLRALLNVEKRFQGATTAAEVLYSGRDPFTQKLFVDKGESAGVQPGQAVIDEVGVVGQVTRVFPYMAEVTLLTDKDHAVPVKVELPELRFLSPNVEIQAGDKLLTSGIDGTYPSGLAVAQVVSVERETGQIFARVTCKPLAGVEKSPHLLILGRAAAPPQRPEEPAESDTPRKGRGRHRG